MQNCPRLAGAVRNRTIVTVIGSVSRVDGRQTFPYCKYGRIALLFPVQKILCGEEIVVPVRLALRNNHLSTRIPNGLFYAGEMKPFNPKEYKRYIVVFNLYRKDCIRLVFPPLALFKLARTRPGGLCSRPSPDNSRI